MANSEIGQAVALLVEASASRRGDQRAIKALAAVRQRLGEPLRVALAGTLKSGKSTLLNALVGEEIAPTDATECTRVVTWFRQSPSPRIDLDYDGGRHRQLPVHRTEGRLRLDPDGVAAARIDRLEVGWPSGLLDRYTLIDTPGTASNSKDVSARTLALLTPEDRPCEVDAIVYLMRDLQSADVRLLRQLRDYMNTGAGALGIIGVLSRADEVRGGRGDGLTEARHASNRIRTAAELDGLNQHFLPVSGLLALRGQTLRESEFLALRELAALPDDALQAMTLSVDRFVRENPDAPIDPGARGRLVENFGLFGIRAAVSAIRSGAGESAALASELVRRSGLDELQRALQLQFGERAAQMRAHAALRSVRRIIEGRSDSASSDLTLRVDRALAATDPSAELRALAVLRAGRLATPPQQADMLERVLGGSGVTPRARLNLAPSTPDSRLGEVALNAIQTWRGLLHTPGLDMATARAYATAVRSCEAIFVGSAPSSVRIVPRPGPAADVPITPRHRPTR